MKHKGETPNPGTLIATTETAEVLGPNMLLGMRMADAWIIVKALEGLAAGDTGYAPSAASLARGLTDDLMAHAKHPTLRAV